MSLSADSIRVVHPLFQEEGDGSRPISALQLTVREIGLRRARVLNAQWHSRLPQTSFSNMTRVKMRICFGAEYQNVWYAVAIWTNPIARNLNDNPWLELRRFAIAPECPANTASRLLRVMRTLISARMPGVERLISYQDTEVHRGVIYRAAGWKPEAVNKSGVWDRPNRKRKAAQSEAAKVRWEIPTVSLRNYLRPVAHVGVASVQAMEADNLGDAGDCKPCKQPNRQPKSSRV